VLRWFDNIPVLSYALLGGRCRTCKAGISIRYPIVEVVTMAIFVEHYLVFGSDIILVPRLLFACAMIVLFAIDLEHHLLPNVITLPGIVTGLAFSAILPPGLLDALIGVVAGGGVLWLVGEAYYRYSGQEGMGGGDVKMLAMMAGSSDGVVLTCLSSVSARSWDSRHRVQAWWHEARAAGGRFCRSARSLLHCSPPDHRLHLAFTSEISSLRQHRRFVISCSVPEHRSASSSTRLCFAT
jgi:hypothetical protein